MKWILAVLLTLPVQGVHQKQQKLEQAYPMTRNILLVVLDDIGKEFLSVYDLNANVASTPNLDKFAAGGLLFTGFYTNPVCSPTRALIHTGKYAYRTGIGTIVTAGDTDTIPNDGTQLCDMLSGYDCGLFGKWHIGNFVTQAVIDPSDVGYDVYYCSERNMTGESYTSWTKSENGSTVTETTYATTDTVNDALTWIGARTNPWFANVSVHAAHIPMHNPPQSLQGTAAADETDADVQFLAIIQALDTELGRLVAGVDLDTTTVFIVGDNGSADARIQLPYSSEHDKGTVYEGGVNAPLIVFGQALTDSVRGTTDTSLISAVDLYATFVHLARGRVPKYVESDSISFFPRLAGQQWPVRDHVISEVYQPNNADLGTVPTYTRWDRMIRDSQYKLHYDVFATEYEFYDLSVDPYEGTELTAGGLDTVQQAAYDALLITLNGYVE